MAHKFKHLLDDIVKSLAKKIIDLFKIIFTIVRDALKIKLV